ncbi:hypothetical protein ACFT0G_06055 [Streptomyces sp. NPDC057020]|uniref:hypothetical protein n=1 Tax=unclassified Streptomyces TaxID=2593676 RepID=UPI00362B0FC4
MIPLPGVRDKGGHLLGAAGPGLDGPWGRWNEGAPLVICTRPVSIHPHPTMWLSDAAAADWIDAIGEQQAEKALQRPRTGP